MPAESTENERARCEDSVPQEVWVTAAQDQEHWLSEVDLATVFRLFKDNGTKEILYKVLPRNANSKNQVYLAPDLSQLAKIPSGEVTPHTSTSQKRGGEEAVFRSALDFYWIRQDGRPCQAPDAKLVFYPQYPEVRLSGFLRGCSDAPSRLYDKGRRGQEPGRVLVIGVGKGTKVLGITLPPESPAAREIGKHHPRDAYGVFFVLPIPGLAQGDGYMELVQRLCTIHLKDWLPSRRLDRDGIIVPCNAPNCNGNTLESLLGIRSNGYSQPDFRGWEVKARNVPNSAKPGASVVTLFTPEPTAGVYVRDGVLAFVRCYGYPDTKGRCDRLNFGGIYRANGAAHARTNLRMVVDGFNATKRKYSSTGAIRLLDREDKEAMAWSFAKLIDHWKTKHAQAAFVPAQQRLTPERQYRFGRSVLLGEGAEFGLFLAAVDAGMIYYDPGIKIEKVSTSKPVTKRRSQFRVNSKAIPALYKSSRVIDVCVEAGHH